MERLEPVLKQKFWILLGVAIIMTLAGWWMATAEMAAATATRRDAIEKSFTSVPSGQIPNESWAKKLNVVNTAQDKAIKLTQLSMWKHQLVKMTWPEGIEPVNGYWGKFPNEMRQLFRDSYEDEVMQVWKMLRPLDEDGNGIVSFPYQKMHKVLKKGPWPVTPPESDVMWEAREDLWLLEGLFQSIAALNGGPDGTRSEAIIHQIDKLEFRGGGEKVKSGGGGGGGGAEASPTGMPMGMGPMGGPMGGPGGGAAGVPGGVAAGLTVVSPEFDPAEEFGDDGSGGAGGGGGGFAGGMMPAMGGDAPTPAAGGKPVARYILNDPTKPFKTRGFYLSVKMDHTKIPLLIEELTSNEKSVWPIEIVRVQMSRINEDDSSATFGKTGGGGMPRGYPGGGQPPMGSSNPLASGNEENSAASFGSFGTGRTQTVENNSPHFLAAKAAFENALKDPVMAQVTICGIFTLYNKVDEPAPDPAVAPAVPAGADGTVPPATDESAPPEAKSADGDQTPVTADSKAAEPAMEGDEPATPTEPLADKPDSPAAKTEEKPEPKPETKPENPNP